MKKINNVRIYDFHDSWIDVCPHIKFKGEIENNDNYSEYAENMILRCKECEKSFNIEILVN